MSESRRFRRGYRSVSLVLTVALCVATLPARRASAEAVSAPSPHLYTGQRFDTASGLYYYNARYYDPQLGRFIQPDTLVQAPADPQTLNRYSYARNNPLIYTDPSGHNFFKKFWKSIVGGVVGALVTVLTAGAGAPLAAAMAWGGAAGGALSGGLQGGWKGAIIGGATGGALGYGAGLGIGQWGTPFALAAFAGSAGVSYAAGGNEGLGHFAGGTLGGAIGSGIGNQVVSSKTWQNWQAERGTLPERAAAFHEYEQEIETLHAMNVDQTDTTVEVISRPLAKNEYGDPGSTTGPHHNTILSETLPHGSWEMGPNASKAIVTTNTVGDPSGWRTYNTTQSAIASGGRYVKSFPARVNAEGLRTATQLYESKIAGLQYSPVNHNSNYAVESVIYGAGGKTPKGYHAPGFPNYR